MRRRRTLVRGSHHGVGLIAAAMILLLAVTGLGLQHPRWFGRTAGGPAAVAADPHVAGRLLRASPALLEVSLDGGESWRFLPLSAAPEKPVALGFGATPGRVWLLGESELLVSDDGGLIWADLPLPTVVGPSEPARILALPAGRPLVATGHGAWLAAADGRWRLLWRTPPSRGDRAHGWFHRLHTGRWGSGLVPRFYDLAALATVLLVVTGLIMGGRRLGRRRRP